MEIDAQFVGYMVSGMVAICCWEGFRWLRRRMRDALAWWEDHRPERPYRG